MLNVAKTVICMQRIEAVPDEVIHSGSHTRQSGEPRVPHRREQGGWLYCLERSVISATLFLAPSDGRMAGALTLLMAEDVRSIFSNLEGR